MYRVYMKKRNHISRNYEKAKKELKKMERERNKMEKEEQRSDGGCFILNLLCIK